MKSSDDDAAHREKIRLEYEHIMRMKALNRGEVYKPNLQAIKFPEDMTEEEKRYLTEEKKRSEQEKIRIEGEKKRAQQIARERDRQAMRAVLDTQEAIKRKINQENRLAFLFLTIIVIIFSFLVSTCEPGPPSCGHPPIC